MMITDSAFTPAWWLPSAHGQTLYSTLLRAIQLPVDRTERIELPDSDFVDTFWAINGLSSHTPLVILLHGLGGSVHSSYIAGLMHACNQQGWRAVLIQFRGAGQTTNRLARAYHSGDTKDFDFFIKQLALREPNTSKAAIGISLGGNVLLKWLGEQAHQSCLKAAVAVSVPFKLRLVADRMNQGFSRFYQWYLLQRLRGIFSKKKKLFPTLSRLQTLERWRCFWTFDDNVTAPLHGFANVHDYYRQSSSFYFLTSIATPTLVIHALDDPFMTADVIPTAQALSSAITLELSKKGGHVGFISGHQPGRPIYWLDLRIPDYLKQYLS